MESEQSTQLSQVNPIDHGIQEYSVTEVVHQVAKVQEIMKAVMREGEHYGVIPGTERPCLNCKQGKLPDGSDCPKCKGTGKIGKPCLLKPGAEKLGFTFRLMPRFDGERTPIDLGNGHREYVIKCELWHVNNGQFYGAGVGSCSTKETKYRYRKAEQVCPRCGKETIIKGKKEYGGGWLCYAKKGGCGAKFADGDAEIENQNMGRVEHDNPADYYNTVLKMSKKRAHVDAILTSTAASDIFTQDVEDMKDNGVFGEDRKPVESSEKKEIKPPQRTSDKAKVDQAPDDTSVIAAQKELAQICFNLAVEGKVVKADTQYKNFTTDEAWANAETGDLAEQNCVELSSFWSDKDKKVVPGKKANELVGKWLHSTLRRAKELVATLQPSDVQG